MWRVLVNIIEFCFHFRFLSNLNNAAQINILDSQKNRTKLLLSSNDKTEKTIDKGTNDVVVNGQTVLKDFKFRTGAVYTINVYEDSNGGYVSCIFNISPKVT